MNKKCYVEVGVLLSKEHCKPALKVRQKIKLYLNILTLYIKRGFPLECV